MVKVGSSLYMDKFLWKKVEADAEKQRRSKNFIIEGILTEYYEGTRTHIKAIIYNKKNQRRN